jgi:hypothetical protein
VDFSWFKGPDADPKLLPALLKHGVVRPVMECGEHRVYCIGDLKCEEAVAELITRAVTAPEEADEGEEEPMRLVKMRPRSAWWPEKDPEAPTLTPEQEAAIEAMMHTRLGIVCGKPGTGKTSMVMKALFSAYIRGQCVGVSYTGMGAKNQHELAGYGVTAHKIICEWRSAGSDLTGRREHAFSGRRVLVLEESSVFWPRLLHQLLIALGPSLRRIYAFGDENQNPPACGGPSILQALIKRYAGTPVVAQLRTSMRVTDSTGAFLRDQERICKHLVNNGFEWSRDPSSGHPFVFLRRGNGARENVAIIRAALKAAKIDPDSNSVQVLVHRKDTRVEMARAWYEASPNGAKAAAKGLRYDEHEFSLGDRVMFLRNNNHKYIPRKSKLTADLFMNGTVGTIKDIFDEDPSAPEAPHVQVSDTRERKRDPAYRRWIRIEPGNLLVLLDRYGKRWMTRVPPVTDKKMHGLEVDWAVLVLLKPGKGGAKEIYTACSRGKRGCFVLADMDPSIVSASGSCPSRDFEQAVMSDKDVVPKSDFWRRFPAYESVRDEIAVDPESCVYYTKKKRTCQRKSAVVGE